METLLKSLVNSDKTVCKGIDIVDVEVAPGTVFDEMSTAFMQELERVSQPHQIDGEMHEYLLTLLWMHIHRIRGTLPNEYRPLVRVVEIPAAFFTFLMQIGDVVDRDFGLLLRVQIGFPINNILSPSEVMEFSNVLLSYTRKGFVTTKGMPNPDKAGTLGAMAAVLVETGDVLSYRHDHPVYGFVAACLQFSALNDFLGLNALRVRYGTLTEYQIAARYIAASVSKGGS